MINSNLFRRVFFICLCKLKLSLLFIFTILNSFWVFFINLWEHKQIGSLDGNLSNVLILSVRRIRGSRVRPKVDSVWELVLVGSKVVLQIVLKGRRFVLNRRTNIDFLLRDLIGRLLFLLLFLFEFVFQLQDLLALLWWRTRDWAADAQADWSLVSIRSYSVASQVLEFLLVFRVVEQVRFFKFYLFYRSLRFLL